MNTVIRLTDHTGWRYACPIGHRSWEPTNHYSWYQQCAQHYNADREFGHLRDVKTGELIPRNQRNCERHYLSGEAGESIRTEGQEQLVVMGFFISLRTKLRSVI